jgi:hypothetical protein
MKTSAKKQLWLAVGSLAAILLVMPLAGLVLSVFFYPNWEPFKVALFLGLQFSLMAVLGGVLMTAFHFVKKWLDQRRGG